MSSSEPRNPFYFLLLAASMLFIATALAYGIVPLMEDNAASAGSRPPLSPFRVALRRDGAAWLLYELAAMTLFVILSLGLDWVRSSRSAAPKPDLQPAQEPPKAV
jgi:hypothetical protein